MLRYVVASAIALASLVYLGPSAHAQQSRGSEDRPTTLSERLSQVRDDWFGTPRPIRKNQKTNHQNSDRFPSADSRMRSGSRTSPQSVPQRSAVSRSGGTMTRNQLRGTDNSSRRTSQPGYSLSVAAEPTPADEPTPAAAVPTLAPPEKGKPLTLQQKLTAVRDAPPPKAAAAHPAKESATVESNAARSQTSAEEPILAPAIEAQSSAKTERAPRPAAGSLLFSGQSPMLSVEATGPRKVLLGKPAEFTVHVRNAGEVAASNVVITIQIPPFAEVVGAQPTAGSTRAAGSSERSEPLEWKISRLAGRAHDTLALRIVPHKSVPLDLTMQWTCSPETSQTMVEVQEPKLVMSISGPQEVLYGQSKVYKLTLSNPGNGDADNLVVSLLPIGRGSDGAASHKLGTLRAGQSKAVEVELTARQAGALTIKAQAFADGGLRAEAAEQILVRRANLQADVEGAKVKYAGTVSNYRVRIANSGDATADNVQVVAMLPPQAKYVSSTGGGTLEAEQGRVSWQVGTLAAGSERTFDLQCSLQAAGENRVQIMAAAEGDLMGSATALTRVEALADLKLEIRDPQGPVPVGDDALFEVKIRNRGTKSAEGIELVAFFSEGLEATSVQGGGHEIGPGQVVFKPIGSLAAGSEATFQIHARADRAGNHVFRAEVVCQMLKTKLAAEETTHFYGDESVADQSAANHDAQPHLAPTPGSSRQ